MEAVFSVSSDDTDRADETDKPPPGADVAMLVLCVYTCVYLSLSCLVACSFVV